MNLFTYQMKKRNILFIVFLSFFLLSKASPSDSISSVYDDGEFKTFYETRLRVSNKVAADVADYLITDFNNTPAHLFQWAFKDLGLQNKNNEVIIVVKSASRDNKTGIMHGVFDVVVPHFTTFKDAKVDAIVTKTRYTNGTIKVNANIIYSSLLMKNALGTVTFIPQKNNEVLLVTNAKIKFGWFFNIFITKKRYRSIIEWRIKKFAENLKTECERRKDTVVILNK